MKSDAERWLALREAEMVRGDWIDPDAGRASFGNYAETRIEERPELRAKTVELYRYLLRRHLAPTFGPMALADISEQRVRAWRKARLDAGTSPVTAAKAYRLLKAVLNTAVDDGLIRRNPCQIKGAGQEKSPERTVLSLRDIDALTEATDPSYRALVLLAIFCSLRWGELAALRRGDIGLEARTVRVSRQVTTLSSGRQVIGPPKSAAGNRVVIVPEVIIPALRLHLRWLAQSGDEGLLFTSPEGKPLRYDNFRNGVWYPALLAAGLPRVHFHDLRRTGNQLAADAGASLRDLMDRMGHATARAAMIYLHGSDERQRSIAVWLLHCRSRHCPSEPLDAKSMHVASLIAIVPDGCLALDRTISNVRHDEPDSSAILCDKAEPVTAIDSIQDLRIMRLRPATACSLCR